MDSSRPQPKKLPSPPSDGGEGRGEEGRWMPLSSVLSPLLRRGERKKNVLQKTCAKKQHFSGSTVKRTTMFYLQLRNELWKLFAKKRTYIGFMMFLLAQNVIILLFRFTNGPRVNMVRTLEGNGYLAQEFISALTVATFMLLPIAYMLLPLYVSLVGGDLLAKEAEDGTLRMILSRPVSRARLLVLKWLAGAMFSFALVMALGMFGVVFASLWFPWKGLFVFIPGEVFG